MEGFAFFEESIELSRRFRALKLWLSLRYHGLGQFRQAIGNDLRHGQLLAELIEARLPRPDRSVQVLLPYTRGDLVARIHADGEVLSEEHTGDGTLISARVRPDLASALAGFAELAAAVPAGDRSTGV